jgi:hypothetical protein
MKDAQQDKGLETAIRQALREALRTRKKPKPVNVSVSGLAKVTTGPNPLMIDQASIAMK